MEVVKMKEAEQLMSNLHASAKKNSRKYISPLVLRCIYRDYCKWRCLIKNRNGWWSSKLEETRIYAFDSCLAHYLLERCFWVRYGDSRVVSHLLSILFELDGHLGKIYDFRPYPVNITNWLSKMSKSENNSAIQSCENNFLNLENDEEVPLKNFPSTWAKKKFTDEMFKPFDYFIEHAYRNQVLFNKKRLAEQLIIYRFQNIERMTGILSDLDLSHLILELTHPPCAMSFIFPKVLPKLLNHGLFAKANPDDEDVCKLISGIIGICASYRCEAISQDIQEMGNILLRAVKSVDSSMLMRRQRVRNQSCMVQHVLAKAIDLDVLPKLKIRCSGPQELQHICRCRIRESLYDSWQLPNGIRFLPLPSRLKYYINLKLD